MNWHVSALISVLIIAIDYSVRFILKLPINLYFSALIGLLVFVSSAAIVKSAGKLAGAVFFGAIATIAAVLAGVVTMDILTLGLTIIYWAVIGFVVAWIAPSTQRVTGIKG